MAGLHLHTSNRLENLCAELAGLVAQPAGGIFEPETIVVQSLGMGRWLSLRLAEAHGICANVRFPFPQKFVGEIFRAALPEAPASDLFSRDVLPWRIMRVLPALATLDAFEPVRHYLAGERPELKLYQLANKIAEVFDRYLAFRPRMILDWDAGKGADWQAQLWRELSKGGGHQPMLAQELVKKLRRGQALAALPARVAIFGISSLPAFYLDVIEGLARQSEVHLFVLEPTPEWWGDTRSAREELRERRRAPATAQLDLQFSRGNPLLSAFGKLGREFLETITDLEPAAELESFEPPADATMLEQIQCDIFELHDPTGAAARAVAPNDRSLQLHSCHSPMREMEVLHDQLLALFEQQPGLKPHEIVVMAPEIATYAPFIDAVFATAPEHLRIPFSIADRGARAENGVIDTFLRILESAGGRFTAANVVSILESAPLQRNFHLVERDLETIRSWIEKTGIRWGIDGAHRAALGLPEFGENSWRAGLDRLLLGYAAPARGEQLFEGILAFDEIEGNLAETLGHFAEFADTLFATARSLQQPRTLAGWTELLQETAARFFSGDDEREPELRQLRRVFEALRETATLAEYHEPVPLDVLVTHLEQTLARADTNSGFLSGRVTFCTLKPMRAVPFRVVCLVGMNDTAFPRDSRPPGFDLVAEHPQRGDRSTRDDDRYLFLEALLSAREILYLSYLGRSIRDNKELPPSVLVSELLDYVESGFALAAPPVRQHRLQAFSPAYFRRESELFSYSQENCAASTAAAASRHPPPIFCATPVSEPEAEFRQLDNVRLTNFFGNPSKFFAVERLCLKLPRLEEMLEDSEPLTIDSLAKYHLQQDLLARALRGESLAPRFPIIRAEGILPPGPAGAAQLRDIVRDVERFADFVRQNLGDQPMATQPMELQLAEFTLTAQLEKLGADRLVAYRLTTRKPKDLLRAWINHLIANSASATESFLITVNREREPHAEQLRAMERDAALGHLRQLLEIYWRGLREPLRFFPKSSLAFAETTVANNGKDPLSAARKKWHSEPKEYEADFGEPPESTDDYFELAFRNVRDPLDEEFPELALAIFRPPLEALLP